MFKLVVDCKSSFFTKIDLSYFNVNKFLFMHICSLMILNSENKPVKGKIQKHPYALIL